MRVQRWTGSVFVDIDITTSGSGGSGGSGGGIPGDSVVEETSYGQSASAGFALEYSRADHTHGTPVIPNDADIIVDASTYTGNLADLPANPTQADVNAVLDGLVSSGSSYSIDLMEFIPGNLRAAVLGGTNTEDLSSYVKDAIVSLQGLDGTLNFPNDKELLFGSG